jgi:hypothetical protein
VAKVHPPSAGNAVVAPMPERDRVLARLRAMTEVDLHNDVVGPLLKAQGVRHVERVHGTTEKGKDFIYVHRDPFHGIDSLEVMQVKNSPFSTKSNYDHPSTVLSQLLQCETTEVRNPETNQLQVPHRIILLSTYELPERTISGAGPLLDKLNASKCLFIGPEKLLDRVRQFLPSLYADFAYPGSGLYRAMRRYVDIHHEALAFDLPAHASKSLGAFYVNLGLTNTGRVMYRLASGAARPRSPESVILDTGVYADLQAQYKALPAGPLWPPLFHIDAARQPDIPAGDTPARPSGLGAPRQMHTRLSRIDFESLLSAVQSYLRPFQADIRGQTDEAIATAIRALSACDAFFESLNAALPTEDKLIVDTAPTGASRGFGLPEAPAAAMLDLDSHLCIIAPGGCGKTSLARELTRRAIDREMKCFYFPFSRIDNSGRSLREAIRDFASELLASDGSGSSFSAQDVQLFVLDGFDEAAAEPSTLCEQIAELIQPHSIRAQLSKSTRIAPIIPTSLRNAVVTETNGGADYLVLPAPMKAEDCQRLVTLNAGTVYETAFAELLNAIRKCTARVIVTSRDGTLVASDGMYSQIRLALLTDGQQETFFRRWFAESPPDAEHIIRFLEQHPRIREVCRTPIIATMIAALQQNGYDLPLSRTDVYSKRFDLMLDRWDKARGVVSRNHVLSRDKLLFLQKLALFLHQAHQRRFTKARAEATWKDGLASH